MSGTKFKVKEYTQHTDSQGVMYEFGAEVTKELPVEFTEVQAIAGNYDRMSVYGELRVVNEDVHLDGGGTLRSEYARITDVEVFGTLTANGNASVAGTLSASAGIIGVITATGTEASFDTKSVTISTSSDTDDIPANLTMLRTNPAGSSRVQLLSESTTGDRFGMRLSYEGSSSEDVDVPTNYGAVQAVRDESGTETVTNILRFANTGSDVDMVSNSSMDLNAATTMSLISGGNLAVSSTSGTASVTANGNASLESSGGSCSILASGDAILSSTTSNALVTSSAGNVMITCAAGECLISSSDGVSMSATTGVGTTSLELTHSKVELSNDSSGGDPVGIKINKPSNGTAYIELTESGPYGGRLVYQGDSTFESLGVGTDNFVSLQSIDGSSNINNVLSYSWAGGRVALDSQSSLALTSVTSTSVTATTDVAISSGGDTAITTGTGGSIQLTATGTSGNIDLTAGNGASNAGTISMSAGNSADILVIQGNGVVEIDTGSFYLPSLPTDTTSFSTRYIGVTTSGAVYKHSSSNFFTGTHIYLSGSDIQIGSSVELEADKTVSATKSAKSTKVSGVVVQTLQLDASTLEEISRVSTQDLTEQDLGKWIIKLAAVGDTREASCLGFNICNENGEVQAGDLLVTSSTPGYLMKQDDDIIRSSTVGKAMEDVVFDESGQATGIYGYIYCG